MHEDPLRRIDRKRRRINDRVIGADEFHMKVPERDRLTEGDGFTDDLVRHRMLLQFMTDDALRQARRIHRNIDLF